LSSLVRNCAGEKRRNGHAEIHRLGAVSSPIVLGAVESLGAWQDQVQEDDVSGRSDTLANDPFGGRNPTSHERLTGLPWDASYRDGPPPWDVGRPQPAVVRKAAEGGFTGAVLDAGCGTGENALHVASLGLPVLGVDVAETALAIARAKAEERGIAAEFAAADAFELERLGRTFETALDCGLFHTLDLDERRTYVASLASVTAPRGTLFVLCFSDAGPATGPHPVSQEALRAAFDPSGGWSVAAIEPDRVLTRYHDDGAPAWFATVRRLATSTAVEHHRERLAELAG
jgi:SAM-dependent methyltransferase